MVKKLISRLSVLAVLIAFMASCKQASEYTNVIPSDVSAIASINFKSLTEKSGLTDKENEAAKQKLVEALKSGTNAATFEQVEKILNNPKESGVDVTAPVYMFTAPSFPYTTLLGKVTDAGKLRTAFDIMAKEQICQPVEEAEGYSYTSLDGEVLCAFNETALMLVVQENKADTENIKTLLNMFMKQPSEKSFTAANNFKKLQEQKGDIGYLASLAALPEMYTAQMSAGLSMYGLQDIPTKDFMVVGNLSFEKGKIAMQCENYSDNPEVQALMDKQQKAGAKLNSSLLKYFPASTIAFANMGINGEATYNQLQSNPQFREYLAGPKANEIKELFNSFNGDIAIGLINVTMNNMPAFVAYSEAENGNGLKLLYDNKQMLGLKKGEDIMQLGENEYVYKSRQTNIFFGYKDKQMYATNDELLYKSIGKPVDKSIKDTDYASDMKGKNSFFIINMDAILELPIVKMMVGFGGEEYQTYYNMASQIQYLEINSTGNVANIDLILKDKDVNALKQIVNFVRKFTGM